MKRRHETVRLSNLELLVAEAGSAAALARLAGTSESYLSQIRNQLLTAKGTPRGVGDELAAKLEQAMGKPHGWMDESHQEFMEERARYNAEPGPELRSLHPMRKTYSPVQFAAVRTLSCCASGARAWSPSSTTAT